MPCSVSLLTLSSIHLRGEVLPHILLKAKYLLHCNNSGQIVVITGYYVNQTRSVKTETMARGTEVLFAATSDRLPSHLTKNGRDTHSCFALIGVHQCGVLIVDAG